jgi:hypothetical protein
MPEGMNVEIAHKLAESGTESESDPTPKRSPHDWLIEIAEAVVLSLIAVTTALCGYHAAKWDGRQSFLYGTSARLRVEASEAAIEGGQRRLLDVVTFNTWIRLREVKDDKVAATYVRRFSPEYRIAFDAWLKTEPFNNPNAPPGPIYMPEYRNALLSRAEQLNQEATDTFTKGTEARENSEQYVRGTVLLATVLFLVALAQRFKVRRVRMGLLLVAVALLVYAFANVATYPRL